MSTPENKLVFQNAVSSELGRVTVAGFIRNSSGVAPYRRFGLFALVYLLDGSGRYRNPVGVDRTVGPGDLIMVFPQVPHAYGPGPGESWTEFHICFEGTVFELWQQRGLLDPATPVYHLEPIHEWLECFEAILGAPRQSGFAPALQEVCRLQGLLAQILLESGHGVTRQSDAQWASRACALLEADLHRELDVDALARSFNMSYTSFHKRFTRIVGQPPARYRVGRLIDRACELMRQGQLSDKQIAAKLGFCDEFYFSRRFKRTTGRSPRQFRREFAMTHVVESKRVD